MASAELEDLEIGNAEAGGPRLYLSDDFGETSAAMWAKLPDLDDASDSLTLGVDEVQTVTLTDATGGTFTLTYSGQTTSAIAYDAAAATVQTALEALSNIESGDVAVTGSAGGPYTATFGGNLGNQDVAAMTASGASLTGEGAAIAVAETTKGARWFELPEITADVSIKFAEDAEDITPVYELWRTSDVVTKRGVDTIGFEFNRRSIKALKQMLEAGVITQETAGASQIAKDVMDFGSGYKANTYRHAAMILKNDAGFWTIIVFPKVRVVGDFDLKFGHSVTKIPNKLKVFAHSGTGFTDDDKIMSVHQMTGEATS